MTAPDQSSAPDVCPRCSSPRIVRGRISSGEPNSFVPREVRMLTWHGSVGLGDLQATAWMSCGLLWSAIDTAKLAKTLEKGGTDAANAWMTDTAQHPL
jgi:DNA-directed RNA polymerase subunit RPC12/RpoP